MTKVVFRAGIIILMLSTLVIDTDPRVVQEFVRGTALFLSLLLISVLVARKLGKPAALAAYRPELYHIVLLIFAMVSVSHAMSHIIDTEIPRLKLFFRLVYALYAMVLCSPLVKRISELALIVITILIFTSFTFGWMFVLGSVRSIPLALLLLYLWVDGRTSTITWRSVRSDPFILLICVAALSFVASNIYNQDHLGGVEGSLRLFCGAIVFFLVRRDRDPQTPYRVVRALFLIASVHIAIIFSSILFSAQRDPTYSLLFTKKSALAGINVNDISGYLITLFPLILGALLVVSGKTTLRRVGLGALFLASLGLLMIAKSRAAWPTMALSVIVFGYAVAKLKRLHSEYYRWVLRWVVPGFFAVVAIGVIFVLWTARDAHYLADRNTLDIRIQLWRLAVRALSQSPVFGNGSENYVLLSAQTMYGAEDLASFRALSDFFRLSGAFVHCHSLFLQLWLDGGFFYMVAIIALCVLGIYRGFRHRSESADFVLHIAAAVTLGAILFQGILNYHFMNYPTWMTTWLLLGIVARPKEYPAVAHEQPAMRPVWLVAMVAGGLFATLHLVTINHQAQALGQVRAMLNKSPENTYVLAPSGSPDDDVRALAALSPAEAAAALYPRSWEMHQLAGEISYFLATHAEDRGAIEGARLHYDRCLKLLPLSAFCAQRLGEVIRLQNPAAHDEYQPVFDRARALDPFDLLNQASLRKL